MLLIETIKCSFNIVNNIQQNFDILLKLQPPKIYKTKKFWDNFRDNTGHKSWPYLQMLLIMNSLFATFQC